MRLASGEAPAVSSRMSGAARGGHLEVPDLFPALPPRGSAVFYAGAPFCGIGTVDFRPGQPAGHARAQVAPAVAQCAVAGHPVDHDGMPQRQVFGRKGAGDGMVAALRLGQAEFRSEEPIADRVEPQEDRSEMTGEALGECRFPGAWEPVDHAEDGRAVIGPGRRPRASPVPARGRSSG